MFVSFVCFFIFLWRILYQLDRLPVVHRQKWPCLKQICIFHVINNLNKSAKLYFFFSTFCKIICVVACTMLNSIQFIVSWWLQEKRIQNDDIFLLSEHVHLCNCCQTSWNWELPFIRVAKHISQRSGSKCLKVTQI